MAGKLQASLYIYIPDALGKGTPYRVEILEPQDPTVTRLLRMWKKAAADGTVGKKYDLHQDQWGWHCSCPSYNFCKTQPPHCKHLEAAAQVRIL